MPHPLIGAIVPLAFSAFFGAIGIWSAKTGRMPSRGGIYTKEEFPRMFSVALGTCWFVAVVFCAVGVFQLASFFRR